MSVMHPDHILTACERYISYLDGQGVDARRHQDDGTRLEHVAFMCREVVSFVGMGELDKAARWLGFVQGVLWCLGIFTIDEMRDHNRPA